MSFRARCAQLVAAMDSYPLRPKAHRDLCNEVRIELEELAKPQDPTDEELLELMPQQFRDDLAAASRALAGFDRPRAAGACRLILNDGALTYARAVLERWGGAA